MISPISLDQLIIKASSLEGMNEQELVLTRGGGNIHAEHVALFLGATILSLACVFGRDLNLFCCSKGYISEPRIKILTPLLSSESINALPSSPGPFFWKEFENLIQTQNTNTYFKDSEINKLYILEQGVYELINNQCREMIHHNLTHHDKRDPIGLTRPTLRATFDNKANVYRERLKNNITVLKNAYERNHAIKREHLDQCTSPRRELKGIDWYCLAYFERNSQTPVKSNPPKLDYKKPMNYQWAINDHEAHIQALYQQDQNSVAHNSWCKAPEKLAINSFPEHIPIEHLDIRLKQGERLESHRLRVLIANKAMTTIHEENEDIINDHNRKYH